MAISGLHVTQKIFIHVLLFTHDTINMISIKWSLQLREKVFVSLHANLQIGRAHV